MWPERRAIRIGPYAAQQIDLRDLHVAFTHDATGGDQLQADWRRNAETLNRGGRRVIVSTPDWSF